MKLQPRGISELSPRTFCTLSRELSSRRRDNIIVLEQLSGVRERSMIIAMSTTARPQQRYDHRLRNFVHRTGDVTVATNLGVPRSTARGWLEAAQTVVIGLDVADLGAVSTDILHVLARVVVTPRAAPHRR